MTYLDGCFEQIDSLFEKGKDLDIMGSYQVSDNLRIDYGTIGTGIERVKFEGLNFWSCKEGVDSFEAFKSFILDNMQKGNFIVIDNIQLLPQRERDLLCDVALGILPEDKYGKDISINPEFKVIGLYKAP